MLLSVLLGVFALVGWSYNSGFRRTERGPLVRGVLFVMAATVLLVMRHAGTAGWRYGILAGALLIGGLAGRNIHPRGHWMLLIALAAIMGAGWVLTALVLVAFTVTALFLSPAERR